MATEQIGSERPLQVVMFGGGPVLTPDAKQFLCRLQDHPDIVLLGAFCQAASQSFGAIFKDLRTRRGILALPLLVLWYINSWLPLITQPKQTFMLRQKLDKIKPKIHFVAKIHAQEVLDQVRSLSPDLGLIYGSPILKPDLFAIPSMGTLGIHHGKLPQYRGNKTMFWAMYNGEQTAGVTIQKVNAGLDTGQIIKEGEVVIGRRSQRAVWHDLETLGLDLYMQAILEVKSGIATYRPQPDPKGNLYRNPKVGDYVRFWQRRLKRQLN